MLSCQTYYYSSRCGYRSQASRQTPIGQLIIHSLAMESADNGIATEDGPLQIVSGAEMIRRIQAALPEVRSVIVDDCMLASPIVN